LSRDQPQTFRRGGMRQTSEGWRRSRGDDDDNNEQSEDSSTPVNGSTSWTSRGGSARRGGGSMEQRTKSNDKWNYNDDRSGIHKNKRFAFCFAFIFVFFFKVHRVIMNQINNVVVDGEQIHLCLIVILIHVVHKQNEIVKFLTF